MICWSWLAICYRVLNYKILAEQESMLNTPPTFVWYFSGLVFQWLKAQGGVKAIEEVIRAKAALLYGDIDSSDFYRNEIHPDNCSLMNVPFQLAKPELDDTFSNWLKRVAWVIERAPRCGDACLYL